MGCGQAWLEDCGSSRIDRELASGEGPRSGTCVSRKGFIAGRLDGCAGRYLG